VTRRYPARIDQLLEAAVRAFAVGGYAGTSTAEVAREAGVSQPYIVRVFGTKEALFVESHRYAGEKVLAAFRAAAASAGGFEPRALGLAYRELVLRERDALMIYMHAFSATRHPAIAAEARRLFAEIHDLLRELGGTEEQLRDFLGRGMLINSVLAMELPDHADELELVNFLNTLLSP
jgi:AcrR family transcriptional regulator